jgi:hypothetical protein
MPRVYIETSFVSACVTTRTSLRSAYERETSLLWWSKERERHEVFVSDEVLNELSRPAYPRREEALRFIREVPVLTTNDDMVAFAQVLVSRMVMPTRVAGDALHVATAVVAGMDFVLTWNVKHLANPNKVLHLNAICIEHGYICPRILRPDDMQELER